MSIFSERLKELRGTESQASFATAVGLNRVQYAKYENGTNTPSVEALERICRIHACSADWLLGLKDNGGSVTIASGNGSIAVASSGNKVSVKSKSAAPKDCEKCPYKKKLEKLEKMIAK